MPFTKLAVVNWQYDAAAGGFVRYQDGEVFNARMPDAKKDKKQWEIVPVTAQNLIVQFCHQRTLTAEEQRPAEDKNRRQIDLIGSGECAFFIGGRYLEGTWERPTLEDHTTYRLADGQLVTLLPGNTWIEILPKDAAWSMVNADTGETVYPNGSTAAAPETEEIEAIEDEEE